MSLTEKTTHAAESVARLLSQFKGKTKIEGVVSAQGDQTQEEETAFFEILDILDIDTQVGTQLDGIGTIVGEDRKGKTDALYRIYLRARILANLSSGTAPQINEIADLLIADANDQTYREYYPAAWKIRVDDEFPTDADAVAELLADTDAGGVRGFLEYTDLDDDYVFTFADGDTIQTDHNKGFGGDPAADNLLTNGDFAAWTADNPDSWSVNGESAPNREVSEVGNGQSHGGAGNGACNIYANSANYINTYQSYAGTIGRVYELRFDLDTLDTGPLRVRNILGTALSELYTTAGIKTVRFIEDASGISVAFCNDNSDDASGDFQQIEVTVDDVSVIQHGGGWADVMEA